MGKVRRNTIARRPDPSPDERIAERAAEPDLVEAHPAILGGEPRRTKVPNVGRPRVRTVIAGAALGIGALLPGCASPEPPRTEGPEPPPSATAEPLGDPHDAVPTTPAPVVVDRPEPPPAPEPPPPPPPVDPAVSVFSNVQKTWSEPAPGIRHLSIVADGQRVEIAEIDLASGRYDVRTTRPEERGQTVSRYAADVGAVVAFNADFFEFGSYQPSGLAVGDGVHWPGTGDRADWLFFACDAANSCIVDRQATSTPLDPTWTDVVGAAGAALVVDGQPQIRGDHPHAVERHPRTAIGISEAGKLIVLVAAGRANDAIGMTYDEMAVLMHEMGARDAVNLDGGGSSTLVIQGRRVNPLPGHGDVERVVANHVAIVPRAPG